MLLGPGDLPPPGNSWRRRFYGGSRRGAEVEDVDAWRRPQGARSSAAEASAEALAEISESSTECEVQFAEATRGRENAARWLREDSGVYVGGDGPSNPTDTADEAISRAQRCRRPPSLPGMVASTHWGRHHQAWMN